MEKKPKKPIERVPTRDLLASIKKDIRRALKESARESAPADKTKKK